MIGMTLGGFSGDTDWGDNMETHSRIVDNWSEAESERGERTLSRSIYAAASICISAFALEGCVQSAQAPSIVVILLALPAAEHTLCVYIALSLFLLVIFLLLVVK